MNAQCLRLQSYCRTHLKSMKNQNTVKCSYVLLEQPYETNYHVLKMSRILPFKRRILLICISLCFTGFVFHRVKSKLIHIELKATDVLVRSSLLERQQLFHENPPDVRSCNLQMFNSRKLTRALDILLKKKMQQNYTGPKWFEFKEFKGKRAKMNETLHFAFVGDSRIRQLFTMFMTAIPDYDRFTYPNNLNIAGQSMIPGQVIAYSELQNFIASYYWRTLLVDDYSHDLSEFFYLWLDQQLFEARKREGQILSPHPDVLVIGISAHHMLREHKNHERAYFEYLRKLLPILQKIAKFCQVIWLNQYPTQEFYAESFAHNTDVHALKIHHYNQETNKILRDGGIPVWNSGSPLVEEYIRSCLLNKRQDSFFKSYFDCADYIHPGTSTLTDIIQILYNLLFPFGQETRQCCKER